MGLTGARRSARPPSHQNPSYMAHRLVLALALAVPVRSRTWPLAEAWGLRTCRGVARGLGTQELSGWGDCRQVEAPSRTRQGSRCGGFRAGRAPTVPPASVDRGWTLTGVDRCSRAGGPLG